MFQVGECVVYGNYGVCNIKEISTLDMPGIPSDRLYYFLIPKTDVRGTIYAPVDNGKTPIRKIMSKEAAMELIRQTPDIEPIKPGDEKLLEGMYKDCIRSCEGREWMRVIKTVYIRQQGRIRQGKKITTKDERYMRMAEEHLYSEFSEALGIPREDLTAFIGEQIEKLK